MEKFFEDEKSNNLANECRRFMGIIKDACEKEGIAFFSQVYFRKGSDINTTLEGGSYFVSTPIHEFDEFSIRKTLDSGFRDE